MPGRGVLRTKGNDTKIIYILRSQCTLCGLDKMDVFYRIPNATPAKFVEKMKPHIRRKFQQKYRCNHPIDFSLEIDPTYKWDEVNKKPVRR